MDELVNELTENNLIYFHLETLAYKNELSVVQDEDLSDTAAKQYYIEYGREMVTDRLIELLPSYLPENQLQVNRSSAEKQKATERWVTMIQHSHRKVSSTR